MRLFIVDTENIQQYKFLEECKINDEDTIVLAYTEHSKQLNISYLDKMLESGAFLETKVFRCGTPNALDFQIVSYLLISMMETKLYNEYIIISNDKGFDVALDYITKQTGAKCHRIGEVIEVVCNKKLVLKLLLEEYKAFGLSTGLCSKSVAEIKRLNILNTEVHNLLSQIEVEKGREFYSELKSYIS